MLVVITWPAFALVVGALLYLILVAGKEPSPLKAAVRELGRLAFACGLLVLLFALAGRSLSLGH